MKRVSVSEKRSEILSVYYQIYLDFHMGKQYEECFYATVCHVCKTMDNVKVCGGCKMISYCSSIHQKTHWPFHKKLCHCIKSVNAGKDNIFKNVCTDRDPKSKSWASIRSAAMMVIEVSLGRQLAISERQLFMFPKVCEFCREHDQHKLMDCDVCFCVSYCSLDHKENVSKIHSEVCPSLKLCHQLDVLFSTNDIQYPISHVNFQTFNQNLPDNMSTFIENFYKEQPVQVALLSETLTCPLTLLYGLEKTLLNCREELVVHIVGASSLECEFLDGWELLLHWLPSVGSVSLVFIGPNVPESCPRERVTYPLCNGRNVEFGLYFHRVLYHEYVRSSDLKTSDVAVLFNSGLHENEGQEGDLWAQSLPHLLCENVPLLLTSYTREEAIKDKARVLKLNSNLKLTMNCEVNPFSSLRPYRDWGSDCTSVFFQNSVMSILEWG